MFLSERRDSSRKVLQGCNSVFGWLLCVGFFVCLFVRFKFQKAETKEEFVKVRRRDLERLTTEVMQLRDFLPKIVNGDILGTFQKLDAIESSE